MARKIYKQTYWKKTSYSFQFVQGNATTNLVKEMFIMVKATSLSSAQKKSLVIDRIKRLSRKCASLVGGMGQSSPYFGRERVVRDRAD